MKNLRGEIAVAIGLLILLFVIFNPWSVFMPGYAVMGLLVGIVALFAVFAIFFWNEGRGDEHERFYRFFADRVAYLLGSGLLLVAIIIEELSHALDPWLLFALAAMIIGKVAGLIYGKNKL